MSSFAECFALAVLAAIGFVWRAEIVNAANCPQYSEADCPSIPGCAWSDTLDCYCTANVTLDIVFALDSSGSVTSSGFSTAKDWLSDYIESSLSADARVGIIEFGSTSTVQLTLTSSESYTKAQIADLVEGLTWDDSLTNTVAAIEQAIDMFESQSSDIASKVFIIITDGKPYLGGGGDTNVCKRASTLRADNINTYIVGVGSGIDFDDVDCLVEDKTNDLFYASSFDYDELNSLLPQLSDITCPVKYELQITEVKVVAADQNDRMVRFVEFYNPSTAVKLSDLTFDGMLTGYVTTDDSITLTQGQYLVVYDDTDSSQQADNVTCDACDCTLIGNYFCSNALYMACDTTNCNFPDYDNNNWDVIVNDNSQTTAVEIDSVTWDSTFPDLSSLEGYSYELKTVGFNNDAGSNWQASCNLYGSPGSTPLTDCATCALGQCLVGGIETDNADVSNSGDECECSQNHYYSSGCSCEQVPPPSDCVLYYLKNGTARYYEFEWEEANSAADKQYRLSYYVQGNIQSVTLYPRTKVVTDYDTTRSIDETPGYVQTVIMDNDNNARYSTRVNCTTVTQAPTSAPTNVPSDAPSDAPSGAPTPAPTFQNPWLYIGGDICEQDRCDCYGTFDITCTGNEITTQWAEGATKYVTVEQRPIDFPYTTLIYWTIAYRGQTTADAVVGNDTEEAITADTSSSSRRRLNAVRRLMSERIGADVSEESISLVSQKNDGRRLQSVFSSTEVASIPEPTETEASINVTTDDASSDFWPTSGYINVSLSETDGGNYGKIALDVLSDGDSSDSPLELFVLRLVNCSVYSSVYEECNVVYPRELYIILENSDSSLTTVNTNEEEMPAWLWWVIAALAVFLVVLAWLVYRYWWKNKETNDALAETQDELDQAIEEADLGFGRDLGQGDVGFNPLATGVPGSARPTDAVGTELASRQNMFGNDKADVAVEKFHQKEQFGQVAPQRHEKGGNDLSQPFL